MLNDRSTVILPIATVHINTPFYKGIVMAHVLDHVVADLVLRNIQNINDKQLFEDHSDNHDDYEDSNKDTIYAVTTRSTTRQISMEDPLIYNGIVVRKGGRRLLTF